MFTKLLVLSCLVAVVFAASPFDRNEIFPDGTFAWSYLGNGSDQIQRSDANGVFGSVRWLDPDGVRHEVKYTAGEGGYQPEGADIPVAPEIPAQIARALDWIAAHPQPEE